MRVITVEEHFHHPEAVARVLELSGPASSVRIESDHLPHRFTYDTNSAEQLGGSRLEHMDRAGIDIQVVSHGANSPGNLDHPDAIELCRMVNDALAAQITQHPDRFRGFATIPLHNPEAAAEEMRRCVNELGFVGTLVMGTCGGLFLDNRRFSSVLAAAEEVDLPIYLHPGPPSKQVTTAYYTGNWPATVQFIFSRGAFGWHAEAGIHVLRLILSGALDRHPNLKLLSGHWGELMAFWLNRLDSSFGYTDHLDRPISDYYRNHVWVTPSGMYNRNQLNFILAELGAERIIHSEDFPYAVREEVSIFLEQADLTDDQHHAIAHRNAEQVMRI
ncbi:amidohydrolase family protein [Mycobacterium sp. HNNTM2301]|uniref:amidohydrolase family protein n=1 Tax=Mycobacterium hainanense TaxID=3289775 RepID=UPI0035A5B879